MAAEGAPAGILLAAGAGTRFGGGKLLQALPDGTPIGVASLRALLQSLDAVTAVTRKGDDLLARLLQENGARVVVCEDATLGMGHSLACAVAATPQASGWVVALADMPSLQPATIIAVARALAETGQIVVPVHAGQRGHPVGFPARLRTQLLGLKGDEGARTLLRDSGETLVRLEVDDPGAVRDIDTPADLRALTQSPPAVARG